MLNVVQKRNAEPALPPLFYLALSFGAPQSDYVLTNPGPTHNISVTRLAARTGTSVGTVVRFCQRIGFSRYATFRTALTVELLTPGCFPDQQIVRGDEPWSAMSETLHGGMNALRDTLKLLDQTRYAARRQRWQRLAGWSSMAPGGYRCR